MTGQLNERERNAAAVIIAVGLAVTLILLPALALLGVRP